MTNEKKQVKRALALQEAFRNLREYTKSPAFTIHQLQDTLDCLVKEVWRGSLHRSHQVGAA